MLNAEFIELVNKAQRLKEKDFMILYPESREAWDYAHMTVGELVAKSGMRVGEFAKAYAFPPKTVENWLYRGTNIPLGNILLLAESMGLLDKYVVPKSE